MPFPFKDYKKLIDREEKDEIKAGSYALKGFRIAHVNATAYGGGVAEILRSLVFLMNDIGIDTEWRVMKGNPSFFDATKTMHNALQGEASSLSQSMKRKYLLGNEDFSKITHLEQYDGLVIHDPQPLACIDYFKRNHSLPRQKWAWRCHIDLSKPNPEVFGYLKQFIEKYDTAIVSNKNFVEPIEGRTKIIFPSIDPLSQKNMHLSDKKREKIIQEQGIPTDKPILTQVSRFDKWKDPLGVLNAFKIVKKKCDCRLVLLGNFADDDPEGEVLYRQLLKESRGLKDIHLIWGDNDYLVNALQAKSAVILQKSLKEGFGLTVSEALWKKTPVIGGNAGGIPLQLLDGETGFVVNSVEECAEKIVFLLQNPEKGREMGIAGHEHVKKNFLITRHLLDYINLLKFLLLENNSAKKG